MLNALLLILLMVAPVLGAKDFSASTDKITLANQVSGNTFSVSVWVFLDSAGPSGFGNIWRRAATATVLYTNSTELVFESDFTTTDGAWAIARPSLSTWHNIVITYDGSSIANDPIFYLDGAAQTITGEVNPVGTFVVGTGGFFLGNNVGSTLVMDGRLAEFGEWLRVLAANEAAMLADGFTPEFIQASRSAYCPLIRIAMDYHGAASTVVGTTVVEHPNVIMVDEFYGTYLSSTTIAIVDLLQLNNKRRRE